MASSDRKVPNKRKTWTTLPEPNFVTRAFGCYGCAWPVVMRNSPYSCLRPVNFTNKSLLQNIKLRSFTYCKWNPMAVQLKRIPTHEECKCDEFCLQMRLGGEICSSDLVTDKGQREELLSREWLEPTALSHALIVSPWLAGRDKVFYMGKSWYG